MTSFLTLRRTLVGGLASGLLIVGLFPAAVSAAQPAITFSVRFGSDCLSGRATLDSDVAVTWRDGMGNVKAQGTIVTENGYWEVCSTSGHVAIGDKVHANDGTSTRDYVVPGLSVVADRVSDNFYGTGPAGRTIRLEYPAGTFADYTYSHSLRVSGDGTWSYHPNDLSDISGGNFAWVTWKSPNNDDLEADTQASTVTLRIGSAHLVGGTTPNTHALLSLRDASTDATLGTANVTAAPQYGDFAGTFRKAGHNVKVMPGQHFSAPSLASDADWIVPNISGSADKMTDVVTGRCYDAGTSSGFFIVTVSRTGHNRGHALGNVGDADGNFSIDFSEGHANPFYDPANIKSGDTININCEQTTGDWVQWSFRVP